MIEYKVGGHPESRAVVLRDDARRASSPSGRLQGLTEVEGAHLPPGWEGLRRAIKSSDRWRNPSAHGTIGKPWCVRGVGKARVENSMETLGLEATSRDPETLGMSGRADMERWGGGQWTVRVARSLP